MRIAPIGWAELLRNPLDNAVIQPMEKPEVVITAARLPSGIETAVRDRGPGISAGNLDKILWQRFSPSGRRASHRAFGPGSAMQAHRGRATAAKRSSRWVRPSG